MPDITQIENFCASVFGDGATEGVVVVCRADDACLGSRDPDEIGAFVGDDEAFVSMQTRRDDGSLWEQSAVALALDSLDASPLPPSLVLQDTSGDLSGIWLIDTIDLRNRKMNLTEASPLPGTGGWTIVEYHPDRIYSISEMESALTQDISKFKDATVYGEIDASLLDREIELGGSGAGSKTAPGRWKSTKGTVRHLINNLAEHKIGDKEGDCYTQGGLIDGERRSNAVPHLDLCVLDLDTGESFDAVQQHVMELGLFAVLYTTHSNLKPMTMLKKDAVVRWTASEEPNVEEVKSYLLEVKRYQPWVLEGAELLPSKHTSEGVMMFIKHQPMPKFRVVMVLKERFTIMERAGTQAQAINEWKERYAGASKLIGAFFDRACTDPSRLFFTPRHAKDATDYRISIIAGAPLDFEMVDRVTADDLKRQKADVFSAAATGMIGSRQYKTDNLLWFFSKYGNRFDIDTFLLEMDPDGDRGTRTAGVGRTHRCPNDDQHSDAGNENDKGFYCINATEAESGQATAGCRHDACSGLDRVDFTDLICEKVRITDATELKRWVPQLVGVDDDEDEKKPEPIIEKILQTSDTEVPVAPSRPYKNVAEAKRAISNLTKKDGEGAAIISRNIGMSKFGSFDVDQLLRNLSMRSGIGTRVLAGELKAGKTTALLGEEEEYKLNDESRAELGRWNKRYATVQVGAKARVLIESETAGEPPNLVEIDAFRIIVKNQKIGVLDIFGNHKLKQTFDVWLEWGDRRHYSDIVFKPGGCKPNQYNIFKGFPVSPIKGDWSLLRGHILDNICLGNVAYFHWLMTWFSQIFQQPELKLGSAVVVKGRKGVGKSVLFDYIRKLLGVHGVKISHGEHLTGQFNVHLMFALLIVAEEATFAGDRRTDGIIKDMTTSEEMMMTRKGIDSISVASYHRLALTSNEEWIVAAGLEDERRYFVLHCGADKEQDIDFFASIQEQMEAGGLEAMMYEFMHWDPTKVNLTWNSLRKPPRTPWLTQQGQSSIPVWDQFFYNLIENAGCDDAMKPDGQMPVVFDESEPNLISCNDLLFFYRRTLMANNAGRHKVHDQPFFDDLVIDWIGANPVKFLTTRVTGRFGGTDTPVRCFRCPPLKEIRANITEKKGISFSEIDKDTNTVVS